MQFKVEDRIRRVKNENFWNPGEVKTIDRIMDDGATVGYDGTNYDDSDEFELAHPKNPFIEEKTVKTIVSGEYSSKNNARVYIEDVGKTDVRVSIGKSSSGYWFNKEDLIKLADILAEIAEVLDDE